MSHQVELALIRRADSDPHLKVLRAQWDFDKSLLSAALQVIGNTFPHYSRHDASHSHSILVQVERFLGPQGVSRLSGTDAWLLLEAAYHHDAGMIVTNAQLESMWLDRNFRSYLQDLVDGSSEEFAEAARLLLGGGDANQGAARRIDETWPLRLVSAVRIVVAEYRRREHAARSAEVVYEPSTVGIASPRTGLIPHRLFEILGRICAAHGHSFDETMRLPQAEAGVSTDEAHPRFIACLLRLGDLLDLDNGRFCPTMLAFAGKIPASSQAHVIKHAAIRHLQVTPELIEVQAECSSDDAIAGGYEACAVWLDMLKRELVSQQNMWTAIAPTGIGPLPSPGRIEVRLKNAQSLGRLEVDSEKVTKLLQGFNLYSETSVFVRELLQNAVDATLMRVWYDHEEEIGELPSEDAKLRAARHFLGQKPIRVSFVRTGLGPQGKQAWRLTVRDAGVGITGNDIRFMQRVGGSSSNLKKRTLVRSMPEWLRPSGIFGVGLQSLFLVTDQVSIVARSVVSGERLKIRLVKGREPQSPSLLVEALGDGERCSYGTSVECELLFESIPEAFSWSLRHEKVTRVVREFDAVVDQELPVEAAKVEERVAEYAANSWVPVVFNGAPVSVEPHDDADWYLGAGNMRVMVRSAAGYRTGLRLLYRGAEIRSPITGYPYMSAIVDILAGDAEKVLTLSRDELRASTRSETLGLIREAVEEAALSRLKSLRSENRNDVEVARASMAVLCCEDPKVRAEAGDDWRSLKIGSTTISFADLFKGSQFRLTIRGERQGTADAAVDSLSPSDMVGVTIYGPLLKNILIAAAREVGFRYQQIVSMSRSDEGGAEEWSEVRLVASKELDDVVASDEVFGDLLRFSVKASHVGSRRTLPCPKRFRALQLEGKPSSLVVHVRSSVEPRMLSPFLVLHDSRVEIRSLEKLVAYVAEHAHSGKKAIAAAYKDFIVWADTLMKDDSVWTKAKAYRLSSAVDQLDEMASGWPE